MGKIIQLDDVLSNKIAAGEVVERPASVVKELVENAIDANSTVIEVQVEEAGMQKIRVIDNGDGMESEDVRMAFHRHATSKIKNEKDLFRIQSLGFRGEALPSIASVSKLELISSTGKEAGSRLVIEGGKEVLFEPASSRKGTDITVSEIFYNTPARLKYMKSIHTELGKITDTMNRIALAHPEIAMKLIHNDRVLLQTTGNGNVRQVLAAIYGLNTAKKMIPIKANNLDFRISGYVGLPELSRASRNYISIVVNGRFIKNYAITNAVIAGYHTLMMIGRYPICYLHIEMDPILVDVNVHPAKLEVRLSKEQELAQLITDTIKDTFHQQSLVRKGTVPTVKKEKSEQIHLNLDHLSNSKPNRSTFQSSTLSKKEREIANDFMEKLIQEEPKTEKIKVPTPVLNHETIGSIVNQTQDQVATQTIKESVETNIDQKIEFETRTSNENRFEEENIYQSFQEHAVENDRIPPLYPIGQLHGTYILAENENGLYLIDQHAAQERIKYEYYRKKIGKVSNELQELLIPMTIQCSNDEYITLQEHLAELEKVGVFLEPFGTNTFIVRSHPHWFPRGEEEATIREIIDQVLQMKKVDLYKLREETAIMMSCKGSIKANHRLRNDEIQTLLDALRKAEDPFSCPHGRPVIIHFSNYDIEKMFKRIQ